METDKVIINKVNEAMIQILCEDSIARELYEYFTFLAPNYKWHPKYKAKLWDGKIRLFSLKTHQLYYGLLPKVEKFCKERNYDVLITFDNSGNEFSLKEGNDYVTSLNVSLPEDKPVQEYQIKAFVDSIRNSRQIVISPTGSGKSLIIYFIITFLLKQGYKGLIVVPSTTLVEQMYTDFEDYSRNNKWNVGEFCQKLYYNTDFVDRFNIRKAVTITTWQSLITQSEKFLEQFQFIIGDEAHEFAAKSLISILTGLINAEFRIGTTGTIDKSKENNIVLEGLFGEFQRTSTTKELIEKGVLSPFQIKTLLLVHDDKIKKQLEDSSYQEEIDFLISYDKRNLFIRNLALSLKGNTLILYRYVQLHGKVIFDLIEKELAGSKRKVFYISGKTDTEIRENIRKILETENDAILVASVGTFSRASNVRNLHNLIMAAPAKKEIRILQSIGRILRKTSTKEMATLFDIADDLRIGKYVNVTLDHFISRLRIYSQEQFAVKQYKIKIKEK